MRKIIIFILTIVLMVNTFLISASASTGKISNDTKITPRWSNCITCDTSFGVYNDVAECFIDYWADETVFTYAVLKVTVEKRFLLAFWKDVGEWSTVSYDYAPYFFANISVDGKGKYRAHFYLEFYGTSGVVDVVDETLTFDYDG